MKIWEIREWIERERLKRRLAKRLTAIDREIADVGKEIKKIQGK